MRRLLLPVAVLLLAPAPAQAVTPQPGSYVTVAGDHWVTFDVVRTKGRTVLRDVRGYQHSRRCDGSTNGLTLGLSDDAPLTGKGTFRTGARSKTQLQARATGRGTVTGTIGLRADLRRARGGSCDFAPERFTARRIATALPPVRTIRGQVAGQPLTLAVVDGGRYVRHEPIALRFELTCPDGEDTAAIIEVEDADTAAGRRQPIAGDRTVELRSGELVWKAVIGDDGVPNGTVRYRFTRPDGVVCDSGALPWSPLD